MCSVALGLFLLVYKVGIIMSTLGRAVAKMK